MAAEHTDDLSNLVLDSLCPLNIVKTVDLDSYVVGRGV
jgi:hypothetical protein